MANYGWTTANSVTILHFVLGTFVWSIVSYYLHTIVSTEFPFVLRVWWVLFFPVSCYSVVIDFVSYCNKTLDSVSIFFVSDIGSSVLGLFLCFVGLFHKTEPVSQSQNMEEPLLSVGISRGETASPYENASFVSLLTFSWMNDVIAKGNKRTLDLEDVPQLASIDKVGEVFPVLLNKVASFSDGENQITTFGLSKALLCIMWKVVVVTGFLSLTYTLLTYVGPYLIDSFVQYLNGNKVYEDQGLVLVVTFVISNIIGCFAQRHCWFKLQQAGIKARSAIIALIYQKGLTLTLSGRSKQGNSSGEIINFMAVDERVGDYAWHMHSFWQVLLQVGVAMWHTYYNLGLAFIASLLTTIVVLLVILPLGRIQEKLQDDLMKSKDKRMKSTSEILRNMRILKLQGWEMKFLTKIIKLREEEESALKKYVYTFSLTSFIF